MDTALTPVPAETVEIVIPAPPADALPEDVHGAWSPSPSPDGATIAFVSDRSGRPDVWLRGLDQPNPILVPTPFDAVSSVTWSPYGGVLVLAVHSADGSRVELHAVPAAGGRPRPLVADPGRSALAGPGIRGPWTADGRLLVTDSGREGIAMIVDPLTARREVLAAEPTLVLLDISDDGRRVLLRTGPRGDRTVIVLDRATGLVHRLDAHLGTGTTDTGCLSPDGATAYLVTDRGRAYASLLEVSLASEAVGEPRVLAARAADLELARIDRAATYAVLSWNVHAGCSSLEVLDLATRTSAALDPPRDVVREIELLPTHGPRRRALLTAESWDDSRGIWAVTLDHCVAEPLSGDGRLLFASPGATSGRARVSGLVAPELRAFPAEDGVEISGWWYAGCRDDGAAVLYLHGGPESQERPVYSSLFQNLAAAGVSVWALNVRGSSGFGRAFRMADDRHARWDAIEDVAAAARHLVKTGAAVEGRVGVMGRSYGGYLTLASLVHHPELFTAGVDVCGMSSLLTFFADTEPSIAAAAVGKYGSPDTDVELLRALSPMTHVDRLRAPLLVVHGARDTNVPLGEARQLVDALRARAVQHRFLMFEGEGHELAATANRVLFVREVVSWLTQHLLSGDM